jgi:hypothetical protein
MSNQSKEKELFWLYGTAKNLARKMEGVGHLPKIIKPKGKTAHLYGCHPVASSWKHSP